MAEAGTANGRQKEKDKLKKEIFGKEGFKDPFGRFGRGTAFNAPPASYGDYAFILHILASLNDAGRAGVVCPQGVLFRGQPEVEEETGEFDEDGNPKIKRRKADDEHLIRQALLDARLIDAVISLPLNVFYGAGVPACLLILNKQRPAERRDHVLMVYAARHYRELSAQNELRPQDVMRMLVHYHAYGDAARVPALVEDHSGRIRAQITERETQEVERLSAEYAEYVAKLADLEKEIAALRADPPTLALPASAGMAQQSEMFVISPSGKANSEETSALQPSEGKGRKRKPTLEGGASNAPAKDLLKKLDQLEKQRTRTAAKLAERDERIAETRRRAADDRQDVVTVGEELTALYADPDELLKHARVVGLGEIAENEFNLNIPRFVDTFEPEPRVEVSEALKVLKLVTAEMKDVESKLAKLLREAGYDE